MGSVGDERGVEVGRVLLLAERAASYFPKANLVFSITDMQRLSHLMQPFEHINVYSYE